MKTVLSFAPDGTAECLDTGVIPFDAIGEITKRRASHVEPVNPVKRAAFLLIRRITGERGPLSDWTRRWSGPWRVRFVESREVVFTHPDRAECILWEVETINNRFLSR